MLKQCELGDNELCGPLPASLGSLSGLESLGVDDNRFEGELPATLANLVELRALYLNGNHFADLEQTTLWLRARLPTAPAALADLHPARMAPIAGEGGGGAAPGSNR